MITYTSVRVDMNDMLVLQKNQWYALLAYFSDLAFGLRHISFQPRVIQTEGTIIMGAHYRSTFEGPHEEMLLLYYLGLAYMAYHGESMVQIRERAFILPPDTPGGIMTPIVFNYLAECNSLKEMLMKIMRLPEDLLPDYDTEDILAVFHLVWESRLKPEEVIKRLGLKVNSKELTYS